MMLESIECLNQEAYKNACELLFSLWAKSARRYPNYAYVIRRALTTLHRSYSIHQASPTVWTNDLVQRTLKLGGYYAHP